jgi:hypothetical protein
MANKPAVSGFGFNPEESAHFFIVTVPSSRSDLVLMSEHMSWEPGMWDRKVRAVVKETDDRLRVGLSREKWESIADPVTTEFNRRLKENGLPRGSFKDPGLTFLSRLLGKELVLLAWAIEEADPGTVSTALQNWKGLAPEERWWLYTMTNAATGQMLRGKGIGWRKAVRYALIENPVSCMRPEQQRERIQDLDNLSEKMNPATKALKKVKQGSLNEFLG